MNAWKAGHTRGVNVPLQNAQGKLARRLLQAIDDGGLVVLAGGVQCGKTTVLRAAFEQRKSDGEPGIWIEPADSPGQTPPLLTRIADAAAWGPTGARIGARLSRLVGDRGRYIRSDWRRVVPFGLAALVWLTIVVWVILGDMRHCQATSACRSLIAQGVGSITTAVAAVIGVSAFTGVLSRRSPHERVFRLLQDLPAAVFVPGPISSSDAVSLRVLAEQIAARVATSGRTPQDEPRFVCEMQWPPADENLRMLALACDRLVLVPDGIVADALHEDARGLLEPTMSGHVHPMPSRLDEVRALDVWARALAADRVVDVAVYREALSLICPPAPKPTKNRSTTPSAPPSDDAER